MIRKVVFSLILEIISGLFLLVPAGLYLVANQLATGPIDISLVSKQFVQNRIQMNQGQSLAYDQMILQWDSEFQQLKIVANELRVFDLEKEEVAHFDSAQVYFEPLPAIFGQFQPTLIDINNGWIAINQIGTAQWALASIPLPPLPERRLPRTLSGWERLLNNLVANSLSFLSNYRGANRVPAVIVKEVGVRYFNLDGLPTVSIATFNGAFLREMQASQLEVSGESENSSGGFAVSLSSSDQYQSVKASVSARNLADFEIDRVSECETKSFCSNFKLLDLNFEADSSGISQIKFLTEVKNIWVQGQMLASELSLDGVYNDREDVLDIQIYSQGTPVVDGNTSIVIKGVSNQPSQHDFTFNGNDLHVQLIDWYPKEKLKLRGFSAKGILDFESQKAELEASQFQLREAILKMDGELRLNLDAATWPIIGNVDILLDGQLSRDDLLEVWPEHVVSDSREYVVKQVRTTTITDGAIRFQFDEDTIEFDTARLVGDFIDIDFEAKDSVVDVLYDAPLARDVSGSVSIDSEKLLGKVKHAKVSSWIITEADVEIEHLGLEDAQINVVAETYGDATDMMSVVAKSRLQLTELYDLDPKRFTGEVVATVKYSGPVEDEPDVEEMKLDAIATVTNAGLADAVGETALTDVEADIVLTFETMEVIGKGNFGFAAVDFTYFDDFTEEDTPADVVTETIVNPDILSRLGLIGRAYFTGLVPISIVATNTAERVETAKATIDLTDAKIDIEEVGWFKPEGEKASIEILYKDRIDQLDVDATVISRTARLNSSYVFDDEGELLSADIENAYVEDQANLSGTFELLSNGGMKIEIAGDYVDISPVLEDLTWLARSDPSTVPISVSAKLKSIKLLNENTIENVEFKLQSGSDGSVSLTGFGQTPEGSGFVAEVDSNKTPYHVNITSEDAGFFVSAFLGWDGLKGGELAVDGNLSNDTEPGRFDIGIKNARTRNVPFATQLLSLVSITGFADALTGEGVLFSSIDVPVTIQDDRLEIRGARAYGSALGITANGYIDNEIDVINIDGVLVPSLPLNLNTVVGNIPIFGPLIVGSDGQGVFSIVYRIRGNATAPSIGVVPLSSVAPGILRRIFENPTTELPDYGRSAETRGESTVQSQDAEGQTE